VKLDISLYTIPVSVNDMVPDTGGCWIWRMSQWFLSFFFVHWNFT